MITRHAKTGKVWRRLAWALLVLQGWPFAYAASPMDARAQQRHDSAVLRIHVTNVPCKRNPYRRCQGHGTGFLVNRQGYVVTNHHVIAGVIGHEQDGFVPDGSFSNRRRFRIVWANRRLDLAIIKVAGLNPARQPLSLADIEGRRRLVKGTHLWTSGYPGVSDIFGKRLEPVRKDGVLSAYTTIRGGVRVIEHDAATNPGNSGGPVSDLCGRVIAVTSIGIKAGKGVGTYWSVRIAEVIDELRRRGIPFTLDRSPCNTAVTGKTTVIKKTTVVNKIIKGQKGEKGRDAPLWALVALGAGILLLLVLVTLLWLRIRKRPAGIGMTRYIRDEMSRVLKRQRQAAPAGDSGPARESSSSSPSAPAGRIVKLVGRNRLNGTRAEIGEHPLVIGRGSDADVLVRDQGIGRRHARIGLDDERGGVWLEDLGSVNGTWLDNGTRVLPGTRVLLESGDGFYLGNPDFAFRVLV